MPQCTISCLQAAHFYSIAGQSLVKLLRAQTSSYMYMYMHMYVHLWDIPCGSFVVVNRRARVVLFVVSLWFMSHLLPHAFTHVHIPPPPHTHTYKPPTKLIILLTFPYFICSVNNIMHVCTLLLVINEITWTNVCTVYTFQSTRDESSLDRHIYSVLEGGIYVPTEVRSTPHTVC